MRCRKDLYEKKTTSPRSLSAAILSLSLLTVMAGAAIAPALGVIRAYFADEDQLLVQMVISMPAIFIVFTNMLFPAMCRRVRSRSLVLLGLLLYTVGGCAAGLFDSIYLVLAARALVGIGVGIIMPMSTGLLSYYLPPEKQQQYMGYSSAMNQMGGVIATLLSGLLAGINWRASFLVYLMGMISIVLCLVLLPNDRIVREETHVRGNIFSEYRSFIIAMFLLMTTFFIYPANFAMETGTAGVIPQRFISLIMAASDFVAFFGGLAFIGIYSILRDRTRYVSPAFFLAGYILLIFPGGWFGIIAGSFMIGFANGIGVPYIISSASRKAGINAATTVMPLISMALYLAQFLSPAVISVTESVFGSSGVPHLPYITAACTALLLLIWSGLAIKNDHK